MVHIALYWRNIWMEGGIMADLRASGLGGVPKGVTADRPSSPSVGDVFYNGTLGYLEIYTSFGWLAATPTAAAIPAAPVGTNVGTSRAYNNGAVSVAFAPNQGGGLPSSFTITASTGQTASGATSPVIVTGIASAASPTFTVSASNAMGTSAASSASSAVTVTTVPQAPSISGTPEDAQAILTLTGATGGSSITSWSITSNPATTTQTASSSPYNFTGLTNGTSYTFTATATNANGTSAASAASNSITPAVLPVVSGGTLTSDSTYYYRTFTSSGNLSISGNTLVADAFLCGSGAGGSGGAGAGGSGGGGANTYTNLSLTTSSPYSIVIGGGGSAGGWYSRGSRGTSTTAFGYTQDSGYAGGPAAHGTDNNGGNSGNGFSGGTGNGALQSQSGNGGGGAGAGGNGTSVSEGRNGGIGVNSLTSIGVGGGSAGGSYGGSYGTSQTSYGSGNSPGGTAPINRGGAGGSASSGDGGTAPGNGGSGVVVVRYLKSAVGG